MNIHVFVPQLNHFVFLQSFGTYTLIEGKDLTPDVAFSSLALFNLLGAPLFLFPITLFFFVNGIVSTRRLQTFLAAPEVEGCTRRSKWEPTRDDTKNCGTDETKVGIKTFKVCLIELVGSGCINAAKLIIFA